MTMENKEGHISSLASEDYKSELEIWNKIHNITYEKSVLYHDFLLSLTDVINDTYLGPDVLYDKNDMQNHFTWCFDKIISDFEKERIFFKLRGIHYEYLWLFFVNAFYMSDADNTIMKIYEYFDNLFNFNFHKTEQEMIVFTELYKLLDQNLKK